MGTAIAISALSLSVMTLMIQLYVVRRLSEGMDNLQQTIESVQRYASTMIHNANAEARKDRERHDNLLRRHNDLVERFARLEMEVPSVV